MYTLIKKKPIKGIYSLASLLFVFTLAILSIAIILAFLPIVKSPMNVFFPSLTPQGVYILVAEENSQHLEKTGFSSHIHNLRMEQFQKRLADIGEYSTIISSKELLTIPVTSTVIVADHFALAPRTKDNIISFLEQGGNIIFNYHFGYFDNENKFLGPEFIEKITGLEHYKTVDNVDGLFFAPKLSSPLLYSVFNVKRGDLILYDPLPLFYSPNKIPDAVLANWSVTSTPLIDNENLPIKKAGIIWRGNYDKGSWIYFNFPLYVFLEMSDDNFALWKKGFLNYMENPITIVKFPYIDHKKAIFISQDAEFKYEESIRYARLTKKYNIDTTIFAVANLARKYPEITKEFASFPNIELASHSYSHTKIKGESEEHVIQEIKHAKEVLYEITGKKVIGMRPPREELDDLMSKWLVKTGYTYVLEKEQPFFLPRRIPGHEDLLTIPRRGTDDFTFLINLNWDQQTIYERMVAEIEFLTSLNILYTLSIHTHLLNYSTNLDVIEKLFQYLQTRPDIVPIKGRDVAKKHKQLEGMEITVDYSLRNVFILVRNNNKTEVKDFTFRVHWHNLAELGQIRTDLFTVGAEEIYRNYEEKYIDLRIPRLRPLGAMEITLPYISIIPRD